MAVNSLFILWIYLEHIFLVTWEKKHLIKRKMFMFISLYYSTYKKQECAYEDIHLLLWKSKIVNC